MLREKQLKSWKSPGEVRVIGEPRYLNGWDDVPFEQFEQIIDFLQDRGAVFMQPSQLATRLVSH